MPSLIGKTISHYRIIEQLGAGGMGVVYKAEDTKLKRTVALKFLPPALSTDQEAKTRFIHEARAASALDHPNICNIYEIGETDDGQSFIAMACYDGESLKDKIVRAHRDAPLAIDEIIHITVQIAKGLARAHEEGIVHRDVKPANIMLTDRGEVKILDFGLAKLANQTQLTKSGMTLGTIAYMSPEQVTGKGPDQRSDIWSLGVVLYEMLTGQNPFLGDYEQAIVYSILNEPPQPIDGNGDIPGELKAIIDKALAKDPEQRYQTVEALLQDFEPLSTAAALPVELPLKKVALRIWRRHRLATIITATVLSILIILWILKPYIFLRPPQGSQEIAVVSFENMTGEKDNENLAQVIPSLLMTGLGQSDQVRVLTWDYLRDLLKQLDIRDVTIIDRELGYQVCQKANITALVTGSFAKIGNSYVTDVKVIDPNTKEIIVSVNAKGDNVSSILDRQIDELSRAILEGIDAINTTYMADRKRVREITTSSFKAYQYYVRGLEIFVSNNPDRVTESVRSLERAVEIDSTFAEAFYVLSTRYRFYYQSEKQKMALIKAYRHADRTSQTIRDMINTTYAFVIEKDIDKAAQILDYALQRNPYNKDLWATKRIVNLKKNNWIEMINSMEKLLAFDPEEPMLLNAAAYDYAFVGERKKAIDCVNKYISSDPGNPNTMHTAGDIYNILGMFDESLSHYDELKDMDPNNWINIAQFRIIYINILRQNYDQARQELDNYLREIPQDPNSIGEVRLYRALFFHYMGEKSCAFAEIDSIIAINKVHTRLISYAYKLKGNILLDQNDIPSAQQVFFQYRADPNRIDNHNMHRAMIFLKQGKLDSSRYFLKYTLLDIDSVSRIRKYQEPWWLIISQFYCDLLQTEILLAADSVDQAIDYFKNIRFPKTSAYTNFSFGLGANLLMNFLFDKDIIPRALIKKGKVDEAIKAYEELVIFRPGPNQIDQKDRFFINPKYHYRLAKLYQQNGQRQKAIERFRRFLDIWKYADDDLPEKIDAQKRLAALGYK